MLPNTSLFKTNIKNSGSHRSASYNTRNFILKFNTNPNASEENEINKILENTAIYNITKIHEWCHWIQHHCTTFGTFLHSLRFSQEQTTLTHIRALPKKIKNELLIRRNSNKPIFIQNEKTKQPIRQEYSSCNYEINLFCQFWFDFQWVIGVLEDSRIAKANGMPNGEIFSFVFGDTFIYNNEAFGNKRIPSLTESRSWFNFKENSIGVFRIANSELTSNSIMECAATISELQLLLSYLNSAFNNNALPRLIREKLDVLYNSTYGIPFKIFIEVLGYYPTTISELLSTVNILCFIALNPPLPPYYINSPKSNSSWDWTDIYPPARFTIASKAVKKIGLIKALPNHNEIKEYIQKVSEESNLITILDNQNLDLQQTLKIDFENTSTVYSENNLYSQDYLIWVQNKFSTARDTYLPFLANTGTCFVGDLATESIDLILSKHEKVPFINSPLEWTANDKIGFHCDTSFGNTFFRQIAVNYCLIDFVAGTNKYDLSEFPSEISDSSQFLKFITNNIEKGICQNNI